MQHNLELGLKAHQANDWQTALRHYDAAIAANLNESFPYQLRGAVQLELQNYYAALDDFNLAIQFAPYNEVGYLGKARVFAALKDYRWAIIQLTNALDLVGEDGESAELYRERAKLYDQLEETENAAQDRAHASQLDKNAFVPSEPRM